MNDADTKKAMRPLRELLVPSDRIVAFVGGGGKTCLMRALAKQLAGWGHKVLATTTTVIHPPRRNLLLVSAARIPFYTHLTVGRTLDPDSGLLLGVAPEEVPDLRERFGADVVLVEADAPSGRPVKAPAPGELLVPLDTDLVVGVIGLDALGRPAGEDTVLGLSRFVEITGLVPGEAIEPKHMEALAAHPEGLFRGVPATARRVVFYNKADAYDPIGQVFGSAHRGWFIRRR